MPGPGARRGERRGVLGDAIAGLRLPFEGLGLLRRNRGLWPLAATPVLLTALALGIASGLVFQNAGAIHDWVTGWMPALEVGRWYEWLWLGPARAGLGLVGALLFLAVAAFAVVAALLVASLVSSPVLDLLSQRVEQLEVGAVHNAGEGWRAVLREAWRSAWGELQRLAFFVAVWLALVALGLVPGGQVVAGPALLAFTIAFLPLDFSGYCLDRRQVTFRRRRRWVRAELPTMAGFGAAAFATGLVPGLNLLLIPALVAGGTLLALRRPPPADQESPS